MMLVAAAGPLANITLLYALGLVFQTGITGTSRFLTELIVTTILINAMLAVFNLIPIPPLDGSRILAYLLPPKQAAAYERLAQYGPLLLLALIMLPGRVIGAIINPAMLWLVRVALEGRVL